MNRSKENPSLTRKRQEPNAHSQSPESVILNLIKSKGDMGIWKNHIKQDTKLSETVVTKALKTLQDRNLVKEVKNIQRKWGKHYMAEEFKPSKELTGGVFYDEEGKLDTKFIKLLRKICLRIIRNMKFAIVDDVSDYIIKNNITKIECTEVIADLLSSMALDKEIIEANSTGLGEFHAIPLGKLCYRLANGTGIGEGEKIGAMASIPCGVCPQISLCAPDGIISPTNCEIYTKWLTF